MYPIRLFSFFMVMLALQASAGIVPPSVPYLGYVSEEGAHGMYANPASVAGLERFTLNFMYRSPFLLQKVSQRNLAICFPIRKLANIGISYCQYGYALYRDQRASIGLSRRFAGIVDAGFRFDYLAISVAELPGNQHAIAGSLGLIARITSELKLGVSLSNFTRPYLGVERLNQEMCAGLSWLLGRQAEWFVQTDKNNQLPVQWSTGIRYDVSKKFGLRAGISSGSERYSMGYMFKTGKWRIAMSSGYHEQLGFSPEVMIAFN